MQHDFTLVPNGSQTIDVVGRFFKYVSGTGKIRVRATNGGYIDLLPGQGVSNQSFTSLTVQDRTGSINAGSLLAGDFEFRDERISGQVEVIDGGKARAQTDRSAFGYCGAAATASMFGHVQLFNPSNSGVNVYVGQIMIGAAVGSVNFARQDTPLTNLIRQGQRKRVNAPQSAIEMRMQLNATQLIQTTTMGNIDPAVKLMKFIEPIMVPPGCGLLVVSAVQNDGLGGTFEFFEEPVV